MSDWLISWYCKHKFLWVSLSLSFSLSLSLSLYIYVIYWPSTEPSIKRCTCVNKRKNSGSRWTWDNNITRTQSDWVSWEQDASVRISLQAEGLRPSVTHGWATQPRWWRSAAMIKRTWGQYSSLSPSPTHLSHTTNITLSRIKCERLYFYKEVCSFVHKSRHYVWLCFACICIRVYILWVYNIYIYIYICVCVCVCVCVCSYYLSLAARLPNNILCPRRAVVGKFLLVDQHWNDHVKRSIGEHYLIL